MCYKCLYALLLIVFGILFYVFLPSEYFASWITALATLAMAIFAGIALSSWQKEFKAKKIFEMYECLLTLMYEINKFLDNLYATYEKEDFCKTQLEKYSNDLKLYANKILIVNNTKLAEFVNKLSIFIEPIKYHHEQNDDGSYNFWYEEFTKLYLGNKEKFRENTNQTVSTIIELCNKELRLYYK